MSMHPGRAGRSTREILRLKSHQTRARRYPGRKETKMKITATSTFHEMLSVSFAGCKEGINIRRLRGPRSKYCLDYSHANSHVCGCGFPVSRTIWDAGDTYGIANVSECGPDGDRYGKGYIRFEVFPLAIPSQLCQNPSCCFKA